MINSSSGDGALRRDSFDSGRRRKYQLSYNQWKKSSLIPSRRLDREHLGKKTSADLWALVSSSDGGKNRELNKKRELKLMMVHINFAALLYKYLIISYLKLGLTFLRYLRK